MASQVRYFVRFTASAGIYQAGDVVALQAVDFQREWRRKPEPIVELQWEQHEELDQLGHAVSGSEKKVVPPPAPPKTAAADIEALKAENEKLKARIAELEGDKAQKKKG